MSEHTFGVNSRLKKLQLIVDFWWFEQLVKSGLTIKLRLYRIFKILLIVSGVLVEILAFLVVSVLIRGYVESLPSTKIVFAAGVLLFTVMCQMWSFGREFLSEDRFVVSKSVNMDFSSFYSSCSA